ncbi:putative RNA helicase [Babesia divergens]|uniref:ATP-dependent RNA helicase n=1 Tax=Babesia divergens TaxID=32595 RepID=A0AAD9GJT4_BABDI|nr:putative RNA helicase [Babesia divergens]
MGRIRPPKMAIAQAQPTPNHVGAPLVRHIVPFPADVRVWGSSVIEYRPRLSQLTIEKASQTFHRRFKRVKPMTNGQPVVPNGIQLGSLQPQLAGTDLFIAAPPQSGKTLLYLLPEAVRQAYIVQDGLINTAHKTLVLVPTADLVLLGSRKAAGVLRQTSNVQALYYKDVLDGSYREIVSKSNVVYATPHCAIKATLKTPNIFEDVRLLILDEAQRLLKSQSAVTVMRLKTLLHSDIQTVVLSPRNDTLLRQFVSRALRVDMKVISFCPEYDGSKVTQHIWGPQRSAAFELVKNLNIQEEPQITQMTAIEQKVKDTRSKILQYCKSHEVLIDPAYKCEYMLYDPFKLSQIVYAALKEGKRIIVFFPTVRMTQFCYVYFKHLVGVKQQLYALHGGLSPEKRRFTIDVFASVHEGVLFCTDMASLGLNLGDVDLIVHVGAPESVDVLADRVGMCRREDKRCRNLLILHDLDAHLLYEAAERNCDIKPTESLLYKDVSFQAQTAWVNNSCYRASCELMYRSLLGYYCNNASRLKFQRWQVPSLVYELIRSFGFTDTFSVTKQFASRLQLWDAPGLVIDNKSTRKTELQAAAAGHPGFRSRFMQTKVENIDELIK